MGSPGVVNASVDTSMLEKYLINRDKLLFSNKLYELGYSDLSKYYLYINKRVEFIGKPVSVTFGNDKMILTFPNSIKASLPYALIKHPVEEFYKILRLYTKWTVVLRYEPMIVSYEELSFEPAYDIAEKLIDHINPVDILIRGLGYKLTPETYRLMIPRILPLIKTPYPIHLWQLTRYNSGKTHYGIMMMKLFRFFYSTAVPSQAGLLYDARTGTYGWALLSDGIVFDEIDKWSLEAIMRNDILSYLPTLMEQGIVIRPTTRHTFLGVIERKIPFIFMGNIPAFLSIRDHKMLDRQKLESYLTTWGDHVGAISDRISVVDISEETPFISDYVEDTVLPEGILVAVVDLVNRRVSQMPTAHSSLSGRLKRHAEMVHLALNALNVEADISEAEQIVLYGWNTWWENVRKM